MSTINSWKAFIKAQEILVNEYSEPFTVVFEKTGDTGAFNFTIEQKEPLRNIMDAIKKSFPGIQESDINVKDGYLLYDSSQQPQNINSLKESAEANYFEFDYKPCFSGIVNIIEDPFNWTMDLIGKTINYKGELFATMAEIEKIDQKLIDLVDFHRSETITGRLQFTSSKTFKNHQLNSVLEILKKSNILGKKAEDNSDILVDAHNVNKVHIDYIEENTAYKYLNTIVVLNVEGIKADDIIYNDDSSLNNELVNIIAELNSPDSVKIIEKAKSFIFKFSTNNQEYQSKILHAFESYFLGKELTYNSHSQCVFRFSNRKLKILTYKLFSEQLFKIDEDNAALFFEFRNRSELDEIIEIIKTNQFVKTNYKEAEQYFKIQLNYESPLKEIQSQLEQIPAIRTTLATDGLSLSLFCFFNNHDLLPILKDRIKDAIIPNLLDNMKYDLEELREGKLKYFLNYKKEEFEADINNKFKYLNGEELYLCETNKPTPLGTISKIRYPNIVVQVDSSLIDNYIPSKYTTVCCTLKGERDKIKRLSDTIDIIFSNSSQKILNKNLNSILIDSSKAESFPGNILHTEDYKSVLSFIDSLLLSKNINDQQKEAITKCLLAKDFFLIQGPPGTGKSTAIAELIWQHIRFNKSNDEVPYRILVTSETNLAVDNALDKLRSKNHLLIKPIRFGSDTKMDKEGKRFSLETLNRWSEIGEIYLSENNTDSNILQDWIVLIANRAISKRTEINSELSEKWLTYLTNANAQLRSLFFNNYIQNVNVIGATCSSIGKENSEQKFTRFFSDYCNVVHTKEYEAFRLSINKATIAALKIRNIEFDLVVQDEASKASPPELALPCLYGKKAVVIGDHRQLPPMVDTTEFIENLKMMSKKTKDEKNRVEINNLISYIKRNKEEFSISHFEKLFIGINENLRSSFNVQYRMHPAINETIKQFYIDDGGLECGIPDEIANSEDMSHPLNRYHGVTANKKTHVIWLDVASPEIKSGTSRVNYGEVQAVDWLLSYFKKSPGYKKFVDYWPAGDVEQKQIGIITFYGAQAGLLNKLKDKYPDVPLRISPVDRFQGMERNIVIVSLVRSNSTAEFPNQAPNMEAYPENGYPSQESLGFAEFPNRLNVALSRAKRLLIIVGNSQHFRKHAIYNKVYETIQQHPNGAVKTFDAKSLK